MAWTLSNRRRAGSQEFNEALGMGRQKFEVSDTNGVMPKSPRVHEGNHFN